MATVTASPATASPATASPATASPAAAPAAPTVQTPPAVDLPPTSRAEIDAALHHLSERKAAWVKVPIRDRRAVLRELIRDFSGVAARWVEASRVAKGLTAGSPAVGEEWLGGPYFILRNLQLLDRALADVERYGRPQIPGPVTVRPDGQVVAQVFPEIASDRLFYRGFTAEVWMQPGVTEDNLADHQAGAYRHPDPHGRVCLVLGAGNVSSIGPMDVLYKLFVDNQVVILKMHPVNAYLGPLLAEGFVALTDWGVLRIVYGGADVGAYVCEHPEVDEIHVTGSDKTVEAIVFGPGEEGERRKAERRPRLEKPITSELGNVSPVIVVPGPWSADDVAYHAESLASMLTNNAGFNCNAVRVIVQHAGWDQRGELLDALRRRLARTPPRAAYYPGADERHADFVAAHPGGAEELGNEAPGKLPWTLIAGVDPEAEDEICYAKEAFCGLCAETALEATTVPEYLARAVDFANERLWGTLNCTLIIHPETLRDPEVAAAFDRALADLRYGTIAVNSWAAIGYGLVIAPWGAFPGHDLYDIESGTGVVHNTLMFDRPQKTVVRTPFRVAPKPVWFQGHRTADKVTKKLTRYEAAPSPAKLPGIFWEALRG